jgi:translation initiation factor 3 subunit I
VQKIYKTEVPVRSCAFSFGGNRIMYTTDEVMGRQCRIFLYDINTDGGQHSDEPLASWLMPVGVRKILCSMWGPLDRTLVTGHDDGHICLWDVEHGKLLEKIQPHTNTVNNISASFDGSVFVSASKDNTAQLFDMRTLQHLKTYKTDRPVNSAVISPNMRTVLLGGGQDARDVTTTSARAGKFEARFFHLVYEEEMCRVRGHFGPINTVAFHPSGRSYASGGEDGFIRLHHFDEDFFELEKSF